MQAKVKLELDFKKKAEEVFFKADGRPKITVSLEEFEKLQKEFKMLSRPSEELMFNMLPPSTTGLRTFSINGSDGVEVWGVGANVEVYEISALHGELHHVLGIVGRDIDRSRMGCT